jgi:FkbM family methyltransferase
MKLSRSSFLGRVIRIPLDLLPRNALIPVVRGPLRGYRWVIGSGNHGYWLGTYENDTASFFASLIKHGDVVYDIGANVGYYTLLASKRVGPQGRVVAFEPLSRNLGYLRRHIEANRCHNVTIMGAAVSRSTGQMSFEMTPNASMGKLSDEGGETVDTLALDECIETRGLPEPTHLKIDVEGGEEDVLLGASRLLQRVGPVVLLAIHSRALNDACCRILKGSGYHLRSLNTLSLEETNEIYAWR